MQIAQALYAYMSEEPALYAGESWHAAAFMADVCQELNLRWCDCASRYLALERMFEALRTAMIKIDLAQRGTHKYEHAVLSECVLWKNAIATADFVIMNGGIAGDDPAFSSNKHCEGGSCSVIDLDQVRALALQLCHDMKENFDARLRLKGRHGLRKGTLQYLASVATTDEQHSVSRRFPSVDKLMNSSATLHIVQSMVSKVYVTLPSML